MRPPLNLSILIADDWEDSVEVMAILLGLFGYYTQIARDGVEALRAARETDPDVALLDIAMPKLGGLDVARQIRAAGGTRPLLIAVSGYCQPGDRSAAMNAGFDYFFAKPFEPEALLTVLEGHALATAAWRRSSSVSRRERYPAEAPPQTMWSSAVKRRGFAAALALSGCLTPDPVGGERAGGGSAPAGTPHEGATVPVPPVATKVGPAPINPAEPDKVNTARKENRLVGSWQLVKAGQEHLPSRVDTIYEFTAGGAFHLLQGGRLVETGSYRNEGDALSITASEALRPRTDKYSVKAATDDALIFTVLFGGQTRDLEFSRRSDWSPGG
jgi:CheY-like chemotaxis protein